jgi:hypothetical protein
MQQLHKTKRIHKSVPLMALLLPIKKMDDRYIEELTRLSFGDNIKYLHECTY